MTVDGTTTFGGKVAERFSAAAGKAEWIHSTGKGGAAVTFLSLYIAYNTSP